jgi:NTE family protein
MTTGRPKLGLALGSGAARGMAHIGVLRALDDAGIKPDIIAGASIGALVGGVYAAGKIDELTDIALGLNWRRAASYFMEVSIPRSGLIAGNKITEFLTEIVGRRQIGSLDMTFRAVAAEIMSGREVVIDEGDLVAAIRASIAVPGIFTPAKRNGDLLVDGGLVNPVPVSVCRALGAERVIAVELNHGRVRDTRAEEEAGGGEVRKSRQRAGGDAGEIFAWLERKARLVDTAILDPIKAWMGRQAMPSIFDVLGNALRIMEGQIAATRLEIDRPDLLIRPWVGQVHFMEFALAEETMEEGYRAAGEALRQWPGAGL